MLFAVMCGLMFVACSSMERDGDWDAMKWSALDGQRAEKGVYIVDAEAHTLHFACKNYRGPWISEALEDGAMYYPLADSGDYRIIQGTHFSASIVGNELSVAFPENTTADAHSVTLTVTAGDIFYTFRFLQEAP